MKKVFLIGALIISGLVSSPFDAFPLNEGGEILRVYLGESKIISVNNPTRIVIGNPGILDISNVTKTEMTLNPKAVGSTVLIFWDIFGEQSYQVKVLSEHLEDIKDRIDRILETLDEPNIYTELHEDEGKIFLLGDIETSDNKKRIDAALGSLKDKISDLIEVAEEQTAVEIDVQVLEINKDATKSLGFSWPGTFSVSEDHYRTEPEDLKKFNLLWDKRYWDRDGFAFSFKSLIEEGKARILSRPRLSCQSGKEAELFVGGEKPVFTTDVASAGGEGTKVSYKEYGIKLKIKPTVGENDRIKVQLNIEVSEIGAADVIGDFNDDGVATRVTAKAYPLIKRNANTELYLDNGETLAIGGLIRQKLEEDTQKTPWLGDVPVLGFLFRQKSVKQGGGKGERGDSELFITLTPKIVARSLNSGRKKINRNRNVRAEGYSAISAVRKPSLISEYSQIVKRRIIDNLNYPQEASQSGFEGEVNLSLHLSYTGQLLDAVVKNSSGHKVLDNNAISTARLISQYPPFPPSIENKDLWVDVPIDYRLN